MIRDHAEISDMIEAIRREADHFRNGYNLEAAERRERWAKALESLRDDLTDALGAATTILNQYAVTGEENIIADSAEATRSVARAVDTLERHGYVEQCQIQVSRVPKIFSARRCINIDRWLNRPTD